VEPVNVSNPEAYRARYGIPRALGACHTAVLEGYAIEGHVPAREIRRLLAEPRGRTRYPRLATPSRFPQNAAPVNRRNDGEP